MTHRALLGRRPLHRHPSDLAADPETVPPSLTVTVVLSLEVDSEAWQQSYGPVEVSVADDVRRYVGGVLASSEATRRGALVGVDADCAPVLPTGDY